jgi:transcriptional regulator with XRE-family HTH domain
MTDASPTVRQRELGRRLRDMRNQHGLTVEDVADRLLCSATKISRLEAGMRLPSLRDIRTLCEVYRLDERSAAEFMALAKESRTLGWWIKYDDLRLNPYFGLEQAAIAITSYTMYYIPALLQTEDYARAIINAIAPRIDPAMRQQRIEARLRRQQLLEERSRPHYRVLIDEAVLRRRVGGSSLMAGQLDKLLASIHSGKVIAQIIPFDAGAHPAQDSNFILYEFEEESNQSPVVFVEGLRANQYLEKSADIARYREALIDLSELALNAQDSATFVADALSAYATY